MRFLRFRNFRVWIVPLVVILASSDAAKLLHPHLPLQHLESWFPKDLANQLGFDLVWAVSLLTWSACSGTLGELGLGQSDGGGGPSGSLIMRCVYSLLLLLLVHDCLTWSRPDLPLISILVVEAMVGFTEELAFCGVLLVPYKKRLFLDIWPACVLSAISFGLMHLQNHLYNSLEPVLQQMLGSIGLGLFYAASRIFCANIWPGVIFHALLNIKILSLEAPNVPFLSLHLQRWSSVILLFACFSGLSTCLVGLRYENRSNIGAFTRFLIEWLFGKRP